MTDGPFTDAEREYMEKEGLMYDPYKRAFVPRSRHSEVILSLKGDSRMAKGRCRRFDTPEEAEAFADMLMTTDRRFILMDEQVKDNGCSSREYVRTDEVAGIRIVHGVD